MHRHVGAARGAAAPDVDELAHRRHAVPLARRRRRPCRRVLQPLHLLWRVDPKVVEEAAVCAAAKEPQPLLEGDGRVLVARRRALAHDDGTAPSDARRVEDEEVVHEGTGRAPAKEVDVAIEERRGATGTRRGLGGGGRAVEQRPGVGLDRVRVQVGAAAIASAAEVAAAKEQHACVHWIEGADRAVQSGRRCAGYVDAATQHEVILLRLGVYLQKDCWRR